MSSVLVGCKTLTQSVSLQFCRLHCWWMNCSVWCIRESFRLGGHLIQPPPSVPNATAHVVNAGIAMLYVLSGVKYLSAYLSMKYQQLTPAIKSVQNYQRYAVLQRSLLRQPTLFSNAATNKLVNFSNQFSDQILAYTVYLLLRVTKIS